MHRILAICALVLLFMAQAPLAESQDVVRLATLDWPPYIGKTLPDQGYAAAVAREAFKRSGHDVEFVFMPWKRTVEETREGIHHGLLPEYFAPKRMEDFVFSSPFPGGTLHFFVRSDSTIAYSSLRDLAGFTIGVVRGYVNTRTFDSADFLTKQEFVDDETVIRMLLSGRIDIAVADEFTAKHIAVNLLDAPGKIKALHPALGDRLLYVCFPKARDDHMEMLTAFNAGLSSMTKDGTLKAIMARHGFGSLIR